MPSDFTLRPAQRGDEHGLFLLIQALAEYEELSHAVRGSEAELGEDLFGTRPVAEACVVESEGRLVAFALFFSNYSTFLTRAGLYLEDIFVLPSYRRQGIGKALLARVAAVAVERNAGRLEWSVLSWNQSAISFYESVGASVLPDWRICRITDANLSALAAASR